MLFNNLILLTYKYYYVALFLSLKLNATQKLNLNGV